MAMLSGECDVHCLGAREAAVAPVNGDEAGGAMALRGNLSGGPEPAGRCQLLRELLLCSMRCHGAAVLRCDGAALALLCENVAGVTARTCARWTTREKAA